MTSFRVFESTAVIICDQLTLAAVPRDWSRIGGGASFFYREYLGLLCLLGAGTVARSAAGGRAALGRVGVSQGMLKDNQISRS